MKTFLLLSSVFCFNLVLTSMQKIAMVGHHYMQQFTGGKMTPVKYLLSMELALVLGIKW